MAGRRVIQIEDGEWIRVSKRQQREMCCDCHLVHDVDYRTVEGAVEVRSRRNARATAAARRAFKFSTED